jgi:hypothetical protein
MTVTKAQLNTIKDYDTRNALLGVYAELDNLHQVTGTAFNNPVNQVQGPASAPPSAPSVSASGANGIITVSITPPGQSLNKQLFYQVSYSSQSNFTSSVTTLTPSQATSVVLPMPGAKVYVRVRASYDQTNWGAYAFA